MSNHTHVTLTEEQRTELEQLLHSGTLSARTNTRARILLPSDRSQGRNRADQDVAEATLCYKSTVGNVRRRSLAGGLPGALYDNERPGHPPTFTAETDAQLTMLACSAPPEGAGRWSLRLLAGRMIELRYVEYISHVARARAAEENTLPPWRVKSWCLSGAPPGSYVAKMEDVLDVYQRPSDPRRPQVCLDEKSKELHGTPRGSLPPQPGRPVRRDYQYERHGVCNLSLALEPLQGLRKVRVTDRRTKQDFAEQLRLLADEDYPEAERIVLVVGNLNTHGRGSLYERFAPEEAYRSAAKFEWHYTPEHGSWLKVAECELSGLAGQCLDRRIPDKETVARVVAAWEARRNGKGPR